MIPGKTDTTDSYLSSNEEHWLYEQRKEADESCCGAFSLEDIHKVNRPQKLICS
jgi:hypothetical protein